LIEIGSKTAEKNSAQTNRQTDRHYENYGRLAANQKNPWIAEISYSVQKSGSRNQMVMSQFSPEVHNSCCFAGVLNIWRNHPKCCQIAKIWSY